MIRDAANAKIYTFATTNQEGRYTLNLTEERTNRLLVFRLLGYDEETLSLATAAFPLDVVLVPTDHPLNEIIVKPQAIRIKKDTTEYNVASFSDGTERSMEEVLKKMPGIDVSDNGSISFKGKTIEKILLDNTDMFDKNYTIPSKNIPANFVGTVQAIEHYHDNRLLKNAEHSDQVVLNFSLRDDLKLQRPVGQATVEGGYPNRYALQTGLMSMNKKLKLFDSLNLNNADPTTSFSSDDHANTLYQALDSYVDAQVVGAPAMFYDEERIKRAETIQSFNSLNLVYQPVRQLQLTGNLLFDQTRRSFSDHTQTIYFPDSLRIDETSHIREKPQTLYGWARLKYDARDNLSLLYSAKYNHYDRSTDNQLLIPEARRYNTLGKHRFLFNRLEGALALSDSSALVLDAGVISDRNSQHFNYSGNAATETDQTTRASTLQYNAAVHYYNKNHTRFFYLLKASLNGNHQAMTADSRYREETNATAGALDDASFLLDVDLTYQTGKRSTLHFRSGVGYRQQRLHRSDSLAVNDRRPEFSPSLSYQLMWKKHSLSLFGNYTQGRFSLADYPDYFTGYRSRTAGANTYTYGSHLSYGLSYIYAGPLLQPFFLLSYVNTTGKNIHATQTHIGSEMTYSSYLPGTGQNTQLLIASFKTYMDPLRHGIDLQSSLYRSAYSNAVNSDALRRNTMTSSDFHLSIRSVYDLPFNYVVGARIRHTAFQTDRQPSNRSLNYSLLQDFIYCPNKRWNVKIAVDEYFLGKTHPLYLFLRPDIAYTFPRHRISVGLSAYNMLNNRRIVDYRLMDYYSLEEAYSIVPAQYLLRIRFQF
jgi:hypothetical protein